MTDTPMNDPGTEEPLILERLSDLGDQSEFLAHYPDIRGCAVVNPQDDAVGVVDDLYVDPRERRVAMVAITFSDAAGYGGKRALVPVDEVQVSDRTIRILTRNQAVQRSPHVSESQQVFEPYYEYWSSQLVGATEEPGTGYIRPPGRLEMEGVEVEIESEDEEEEVHLPASG